MERVIMILQYASELGIAKRIQVVLRGNFEQYILFQIIAD